MVRCVGVAGHPALAELLLGGELEGGGDLDLVLGVEHVVEGLDVLAVLADLPRGVGRLLAILVGVGRVQAERKNKTLSDISRCSFFGMK